MPRLLLIEIGDDGELSIHSSSDVLAPWEICGIATWLARTGEDNLVPEEDA